VPADPQGDPPEQAPAKTPEPAPRTDSSAPEHPSPAKTPGEPAPARSFRPALDPVPGDPCSIYGFDGITLGMKGADLSVMEDVTMISASEESSDSEFRYVFKARRPGRLDDVRIAVSGEREETVSHIKATIAVARGDPWPNSIFKVGGSPRKARINEWIWWSTTCKATMRLTQIESLGGSAKVVPYVLETRVYP
jgi:hypothetical protein